MLALSRKAQNGLAVVLSARALKDAEGGVPGESAALKFEKKFRRKKPGAQGR